jgi:hypothetical protein
VTAEEPSHRPDGVAPSRTLHDHPFAKAEARYGAGRNEWSGIEQQEQGVVSGQHGSISGEFVKYR